ncbi:WYL domain-containing protein [Paenibacillus pini]|uniref:Uncharacterized protein n=1 Tax=Paenibacillus pini JCM 16418 TaxID=1236976 RepID=W7YL70_9BACL|nr:WYL domain-containing protein [Paenibacillus pini]GAF08503.1 hypothetical protein JCM16418_2584 [Paenibacillus pini JCM 16418]
MNPFEKIFNYQILSSLDQSGTYMVTSHERSWLKSMLLRPAAKEAFTAETLKKLNALLDEDPCMDIDGILIEKAYSREKQVYHPLIRSLRQLIMHKNGITIRYKTKHDVIDYAKHGIPYKLEYSMVKREWYLLWYYTRNQTMVSTKLDTIAMITEQECPQEKYDRYMADIQRLQLHHKTTVSVQVIRQFNDELSRILYAFSCFEKEVIYEAEDNRYTIVLSLSRQELEYLLSKIRFLGKRVQIVDHPHLQQRMSETATKALLRYKEADL